jgi:hypothetical protein
MAILLPDEQTYELAPAGSHIATCFRVVDMGTQPSMYGPKWQILLSWELSDEQTSKGEPFSISRRYTLSSNRKSALRGDIEGWLGRALTADDFGKFDLASLLGTTCLVGIKHEKRDDGRTFANIVSVMKRPKSIPEKRETAAGAMSFSLADRPFNRHVYEALPQWLREAIARSPEYTAAIGPQPVTEGDVNARLKLILASSPAPKPAPKPPEPIDDAIPY